MKLALVVLFITLACCCTSVSADMCDPVDEFLQAMLNKSDEEFKEVAENYAEDDHGVEAAMKLKKCADKLSSEENPAYFKVAKNVMAKCKESWKED
ncbi:uteroglobin [Podarcis muralis]|uniref:uteroglobin-like n=1 Tax=Podarcis muralis TaxID=64176 RepID=UPI00109FCDA0|nr:uteroglobin-like [Podarcis muralis]